MDKDKEFGLMADMLENTIMTILILTGKVKSELGIPKISEDSSVKLGELLTVICITREKIFHSQNVLLTSKSKITEKAFSSTLLPGDIKESLEPFPPKTVSMTTEEEKSTIINLTKCGTEISKSLYISEPPKLDVVSSPSELKVMIDISVLTPEKPISEPGKDLVGMPTEED